MGDITIPFPEEELHIGDQWKRREKSVCDVRMEHTQNGQSTRALYAGKGKVQELRLSVFEASLSHHFMSPRSKLKHCSR